MKKSPITSMIDGDVSNRAMLECIRGVMVPHVITSECQIQRYRFACPGFIAEIVFCPTE